MSVAYGTGPKGKATRLHAELVRARGRCQACGSPRNLQCAHIISRRYAHTRTDLDNALCLCAACHRMFTDDPVYFGHFVADLIGEDGYRRLREKAQRREKFDWDAEVERLKGFA